MGRLMAMLRRRHLQDLPHRLYMNLAALQTLLAARQTVHTQIMPQCSLCGFIPCRKLWQRKHTALSSCAWKVRLDSTGTIQYETKRS
jgi:hypothetical protein